jgi:hypothetical protein
MNLLLIKEKLKSTNSYNHQDYSINHIHRKVLYHTKMVETELLNQHKPIKKHLPFSFTFFYNDDEKSKMLQILH